VLDVLHLVDKKGESTTGGCASPLMRCIMEVTVRSDMLELEPLGADQQDTIRGGAMLPRMLGNLTKQHALPDPSHARQYLDHWRA
jgi:hypothetical protein